MPTPNPKQAAVRDYLRELTKILGTGIAREHSHRPALISLFQRFAPRATVLNDAARVQCGAPDLILLQQGTELGYVETKDVDANLNEVLRSDQLHRYLGGLSNFLLTNYLEFRWYVMGEPQGEPSTLAYITSKGKLEEANVDQVIDLLTSFCEADVPVVRSPKELAERMAGLAKNIRYSIDRVFREEPSGEGSLHQQLRSFREVLIHDLSYEDFADMYSQTICYGLFAARCNVKVGEPFNRDSAARQLPKTNPFLQNLFAHIAGPQLDARVSWGVDALVNLLNKTRINEVMSAFGKRARREDPVVHFYETFLAAYDPEKRKGRGDP